MQDLAEVQARTSSESPKPLSVFGGHPKSPAQCISLVRACRSPALSPACFVPLVVAALAHALPPGQPPQWRARRRLPLSGRDRRRGTRCGPRGRTCDVSVPAKRGSTSSCLQPNPKPAITPGTPSGHTSQQPARAPNKECRGFQTPGSNLSALAPEWLPGWRSCHKLPRPLSAAAASQPRRRGGGGRRRGTREGC